MRKRLHFLIPISLSPSSFFSPASKSVGMIARENLLLQNYESEKNNKTKSDGAFRMPSKLKALKSKVKPAVELSVRV